MVKIVNCTPHEVIMWPEGGEMKKYEMSDTVARLVYKDETVKLVDGAPVRRSVVTGVVGLPEPEEGTYYIVSCVVQRHLLDRKDLLVPAGSVRHGHGGPIRYSTVWQVN